MAERFLFYPRHGDSDEGFIFDTRTRSAAVDGFFRGRLGLDLTRMLNEREEQRNTPQPTVDVEDDDEG